MRVQYNLAFYSSDFEAALQIIDRMIRVDGPRLDYLREKSKMLASTGKEADCMATVSSIAASGDRSAAAEVHRVVAWRGVSDTIKERIKSETKYALPKIVSTPMVIGSDSNRQANAAISPQTPKYNTSPIPVSRPPDPPPENTTTPPIAAPARAPMVNVMTTPPVAVRPVSGKLLCYRSQSGIKYHASKDCSKSKIPVFDIADLKEKGLSPCDKCWTGPSLY